MATVSSKGGGVTFDFRTEPPLKEFQFQFNRFSAGVSDWREPLSACGKLFQRHMALQFETEGQASGSRWEANEPTYAAWKATVGAHSHKVGVLYGYLRSAMTGGGGYSENINKTSADYGMSDSSQAKPYAKKFDEKRPVMRMNPDWGRDYQKLMHTWLVYEERKAIGSNLNLGESVRLGGVTGSLQRIDWSRP